MSAVARAYYDLVCNHGDCKSELSEWSDCGFPDAQDARETAVEYDWEIADDGDFCPAHRRDQPVDDDDGPQP